MIDFKYSTFDALGLLDNYICYTNKQKSYYGNNYFNPNVDPVDYNL